MTALVMNHGHNITIPPADNDAVLNTQIDRACDEACRTIAPAWPLDRAIAVNPHWSRTTLPVRTVAARMAVLGGISVFPQRDHLRSFWQEGRIQAGDLDEALRQLSASSDAGLTVEQCVDALHTAVTIDRLPLLIDLLDTDPHRDTRLSWREAISHQVSQTCAAYFDQHQASWHPERAEGLYAFWRETLLHDHGIGVLMGLPQISSAINALPSTAQDAERWVIRRLGLTQELWPDYLEAVLLTVNGWASWCAYLRWQADLEGETDRHLRDLLAIRLAWGVLLLECKLFTATKPSHSTCMFQWWLKTTSSTCYSSSLFPYLNRLEPIPLSPLKSTRISSQWENIINTKS